MYLTNKFSSQTILPDSINGKQKQMLKMHYIKKKEEECYRKRLPPPMQKMDNQQSTDKGVNTNTFSNA